MHLIRRYLITLQEKCLKQFNKGAENLPKFKNLNDLEAHLQKNMMQTLARSADIERVMSEVMSQSVIDVVYGSYSPTQYDRRGDEEGLSDVRNMGITDFGINGNGDVFITFENLTEGADSMSGKYITDTIVEGRKEDWNNSNGVWSEPRDFIGEAARRLQANPSELINAFKSGLRSKGFDVR